MGTPVQGAGILVAAGVTLRVALRAMPLVAAGILVVAGVTLRVALRAMPLVAAAIVPARGQMLAGITWAVGATDVEILP